MAIRLPLLFSVIAIVCNAKLWPLGYQYCIVLLLLYVIVRKYFDANLYHSRPVYIVCMIIIHVGVEIIHLTN